MSASLVGSEMCIRDRTSASRPWHVGARCRARHAATRRERAKAAGPAPVSYTHLTLPTICSV
eukprot:13862235-Alexandrium_andersonii.AAC.1